MRAREMYIYCRRNRCFLPDRILREKIEALGSCKRWSVYEEEDADRPLFYNRVDHTYIDVNFNAVYKVRNRFIHRAGIRILHAWRRGMFRQRFLI
ncbi:MAG: hypothetical protein IJI05_02700 [Erysipelotrichaceae bacterium]|nr:hypothetical protein [Erysipelotrichaceae bacterium]